MYTYLSCMYAQSVNHSIFLFAHTHVDAREHTAWLQVQAYLQTQQTLTPDARSCLKPLIRDAS